jgi:SAM-dependent methyltransferase
LATQQAAWLRSARARLLRRAGIARRRRVLDLGAGWGTVSEELQRRSAGSVVAVDCDARSLADLPASIECVEASAEHLPLPDQSFDLVFAQFTFLWISDPRRAVAEACRVLEPGGALAVIEPDYGGLMEFPPEIESKELWLAALRRAGADPLVGRKLPDLFAHAGLRVEVRFLNRLEPPDPLRFALLEELLLTDDERQRLEHVRAASLELGARAVAHLPCWLVLGEKLSS